MQLHVDYINRVYRSLHDLSEAPRTAFGERTLIEAGIHSRRRAANELGVENPEHEFERWLEKAQQVSRR